MQILLASAKTMRESTPMGGVQASSPLFQEEALMIAGDMAKKGTKELAELFKCSESIAATNRSRFEVFGSDEAEVIPAVLAYNGQAYKYLKAWELDTAALDWAQEHLWISSCLYGMLRPLDGINPYRMDGAFSLPCTGGGKVFSFWRDRLTELLIRSTKEDDGVLIYLDTDEFRSLFDWKKVCDEIKVIEPRFRIRKSGKLTSPSVWTKSCRGAMARFIIDGRISSPEALCDFSFEGFRHSSHLSEDWEWIRPLSSRCSQV